MSTYRYICILLISLLAMPLLAEGKKEAKEKEKAPLFGGAAVSVDLVGLAMKAFGSSYSNMEVAARINLYEKYFPVAELGIGTCNRTGGDNNNAYQTTAPYFRVGMDYNFNKKINGNRIFAGARYAFSSFNYDFTNPDFRDPVWHNNDRPLAISETSTCHWLELVAGLETKLWRIVRLGYSMRFHFLLAMNGNEYGDPNYIPGFGISNSPFGGTFYVAIDVGKSARNIKKNKAK